jgi:hypothetical protein
MEISKMAYISLATVPPTTEAIARVGTENVFAELHMRRIGEKIELRTILIDYSPFSGRYVTDEIDLQHYEDDGEAIDGASDMECAARDRLEALKALGWRDIGFGEAVERIIMNDSRSIPVAAE